MKWKKLGRIFDPTKHKLPNNCFEYAQSPQALVFDDFVRIYFSSREKDQTGKFLSHVFYADFDKTFQRVLLVSEEEVISLGDLGCFDEHGIFPMNVVRNKGNIFAYTTGWNRKKSVSADASIGLAVSVDGGKKFIKVGNGPVMTASLNEPFLVCDAFVAVFENVFYMWYIYGTKWINDAGEAEPQRVYKIAQATSFDGVTWQRNGKKIISDVLDENECQALPSVAFYNNRYHMFFCYRQATGFRKNKERGYRIGYAFSDDLKNWTRNDVAVEIQLSDSGWDSEMMCYPHIFRFDEKVYLLYNGNEFGRFGFGIAQIDIK
ncbi:MAG: hypothetical protein JST63_19710 [Bacteroidetes bacterium]|nr:hypothetical protein [Bacteroidota bacterium]